MPDGLTMSISGNKAILDNLDRLSETMRNKAYEAMMSAGEVGLEVSNGLTPVLSGYLQSRNQLVGNNDTYGTDVTITNDADYALPVLLGHHTRSGSWVDPQDFLTPGLDAMSQAFQDALKGLLG